MYDYTIIGAGPTGLTIAWFLAKYGYKVMVIDREDSVGGCHRVTRVNGLFTEHSPRMYIGNNNTLQLVLKDMGYDYNDIFVKYQINSINIANKILGHMSLKEIYSFVKEYLRFIMSDDYSKNISVGKFMEDNEFSENTKHIIDAISRITDGAGADKYTLYEFLEIVNQNILYNNYQPKVPNDVGLFKLWIDALEKTGNVTILLESEVINLDYDHNLINSIKVKKNNKIIDIACKNCILSIPPKNILNILNKNEYISNAFGNYNLYEKWALYSSYMDFISITFHWETKIVFKNYKNEWIIPNTDWLIAQTILSDVMDFSDDRSKTVISVCATKSDGLSKFLNKKPNDCSKEELIQELFRQLKENLNEPDLPEPDNALLCPKLHKKNDQWITHDSAFIYTTDGFKDYKSELFDNLYSVGTQNGNSNYIFTSIESATSNAISFINNIIPQTKDLYNVKHIVSLNEVTGIIIILFVLLGIIIKY
jgi:protoporphyrinogen oxidase